MAEGPWGVWGVGAGGAPPPPKKAETDLKIFVGGPPQLAELLFFAPGASRQRSRLLPGLARHGS